MAIRPVDQYPGKTAGTNTNYPHGEARNITTPGDATGTPWEKALLNDLFGFEQALLAAGGITPSGSPDTALVSQYLDGVKAAAIQAPYNDPAGASSTLQAFLNRNAFWCSTQAEIQAANNYLATNFMQGVIKLVPGAPIPITSEITIDASYVSIEGNNARLDATGLSSFSVIKVVPSASPTTAWFTAFLRNFSISGPGKTVGTLAGLDLRNLTGGTGPSNLVIENVNIQACAYGQRHGNATYPIATKFGRIRDCDIGVQGDASTVGGVLFYGGDISRCNLAINTVRPVVLFGTLLDANARQINVALGSVDLHGCRVVATGYSTTPITVSGTASGVHMFGGEILLNASPPIAANYIVDVGAGADFRGIGIELKNTRTASGAFGTGDGAIELINSRVDNGQNECSILNASRGRQVDGGFESTTVDDEVFITAENVAITNRLSVGATTLATSTAQARTGSRSLSYLKTSASSQPSAFALALLPVRAFDRAGGEFYWRRPSGGVGVIFDFKFAFCQIGYNSSGVPEIRARLDVQTKNITVPSGDSGWTLQQIPDPVSGTGFQAPDWATHFLVEVDGFQATGSATPIYFDDVNVNIIG